MKLRKQDEMEQLHVGKAAKNTFVFYNICLLGLSVYGLITANHMGNAFLVLCLGNVVFYGSLIIQRRKIEKLEEEYVKSNDIKKFFKRNRYILWTVFYIIIIVIIGLLVK
ncbi:hypothetical protein J5Y03_00010 [Bacillus sp. RG28]|uniref:Uncharacterized protein n=1 Tax=Gottfriedia endophytica TaxID=2820819 RepID=A0A940NDK4_9BACI|nr:hypothetical protein [Gottfriedia endophytica]MBP0723564.1 hypothetical protein [Gottfriedia endophytica]